MRYYSLANVENPWGGRPRPFGLLTPGAIVLPFSGLPSLQSKATDEGGGFRGPLQSIAVSFRGSKWPVQTVHLATQFCTQS